jgi:hypothetical protein
MRGYLAAVVMVELAVAFWGATPAAAQQASSFDQLQVLVNLETRSS